MSVDTLAATLSQPRRLARSASAFALLLLSLAIVLILASLAFRRCTHPRLHIEAHSIPADGREHRIAILGRPLHLPLDSSDIVPASSSAQRLRATSLDRSHVAFYLRAPVLPASIPLSFTSMGTPVTIAIHVEPSTTDTIGDGMPDWMRLHTSQDRRAFRTWFTTLADLQADEPATRLPPEITDCASLLRFCYRQTLLLHDDRWYRQFPVGEMPTMPSVQQWTYPDTPLKADLFRVQPGPFYPHDLASGAFTQFADAKTIQSRNAFLVSRDLRAAMPGDLLFFHQLEQHSQYHSMIVTGEQKEWVVYHTGPIDGHRGEMRRVLLADLLHHPDARWRPIAANPNFLGVYRWNLLRED